MTTCSCGESTSHVIARRETLDGVAVEFWSDGAVTGRMGVGFYGDRPRAMGNRGAYLRAVKILIEEVSLYDRRELRLLVRTARRAVCQTSLLPLVYLRRSMAGEKFHFDGRVVRVREHASSCQCRSCGPAYTPGWMPGPVKYRS